MATCYLEREGLTETRSVRRFTDLAIDLADESELFPMEPVHALTVPEFTVTAATAAARAVAAHAVVPSAAQLSAALGHQRELSPITPDNSTLTANTAAEDNTVEVHEFASQQRGSQR